MVAAVLPRPRRSTLTSGVTEKLVIRRAGLADLDAIKSIADAHRHELGFVLRPALVRSIAHEEVLAAEHSQELIGFVEYHHRQDRQTTVYHIAVVPNYRQQGVGRALIENLYKEVLAHGKQTVQLKCPADLPAQGFYARLGFRISGKETGKSRPLVVWILQLPLSEPECVV